MDLMELGIRVDSSDLKKGERDLDSFGKTGERTGGKIEKFGGVAKKSFGAVALAVGSAVAAMASFGAVVRQISEFETAMSRLEAVSGGGAAQMVKMRDIARDLGSTTEFSASQAADGLNFLAMAGFNATEAMESLPAVLDLATASGMGLAQSADIASNVISGFGMAAADAANVADILAAASSRANTDVSQLGAAMSTVAPIAASLDIGIADTASAIGLLSDAGIQGERAGTALRGVMAALAGPTTEAAGILKNLGLTIEDVNPATNDLATVMGRLDEAGISTAQAMKVFGREAASGALVLVEASGRLGEFGNELGNVDGAANKMAETMRDNLGGDIKGLQSALSGLILAMGDAGLTSALRGAVTGLTNFLRGASDLVTMVDNAGNSIGNFARNLFGLTTSQDVMQRAIDNASIAMKDQIEQVQRLSQAQGQANVISMESARVRLAEAQATRELIIQQQEMARQSFLEKSGFNKYMAEAARLQNELTELSTVQFRAMENGQQLAEGLTGSSEALNAEIEKTSQNLARTLGDIEKLKIQARSSSFLSDDDAARLEELEVLASDLGVAMDKARNGQVLLNGEWVTGIDLTERLDGTVRGIPGSLTSASGAAIGLSGNIGAAAQSAAILLSNLNGVPSALMQIGQQVDQTIATLKRQNSELTYQTEQGLSRQAASIKVARDAAIELGLANGASIDEVAALGAEFDRQAAQAEALAGTNANLTETLQAQAAALNGSGGSSGGGGGGGSVSEASKAATRQLEKLKAAMDAAVADAQTPIERFNDELKDLNQLAEYAASEGADFGRAYDHALGEMNDRLAESLPLVGDVRNAFGEWMSRGFSDFKSFTSDILQSFKQMLVKMATTALQNKILIPIATGLMGGGIGAATGSPSGVLGNILGGAGGLADMGAGFMGGLGSVWAGVTSGGLGGGIGAIGTALSGATSSLSGLATAAGALALPVAAATAAFSFFSTKTKQLDAGIRLTATGASLAVQEFEKIKKSRFWGLQSSTSINFSNADSDIADPLRNAYREIFNANKAYAEALGVSASAISGYTRTVTFSTKGMSEAEAQQAIMGELEATSEALSQRILDQLETGQRATDVFGSKWSRWFSTFRGGFINFSRAGETASQTLNRLTTSLAAANQAAMTTGISQFGSERKDLQQAVALAEGAGGADQLAQLSDMYFNGILSQQEQLEIVNDQLNAALQGVTRDPGSVEGFKARYEELISGGQAGRAGELLATLPIFIQRERLEEELAALGVTMDGTSDAARELAEAEAERAAAARASERQGLMRELYQVQGHTNKLRKMELAALDPANRSLQRYIFRLQDAQAAAERAAQAEAERQRQREAIASERQGLRREVYQLREDTGRLRAMELAALNPANRALQRYIYRLQDAQAASARAAEAEAERQRQREEVASERANLERELYQLQGRTDLLRRMELEATSPANRALQRLIWSIQDTREAAEEAAQAEEEFARRVNDRRSEYDLDASRFTTAFEAKFARELEADRDQEVIEAQNEILRSNNELLSEVVRQLRKGNKISDDSILQSSIV